MLHTGFMTERAINIIRGKTLVGKATRDEVLALCRHIDECERLLDEADESDCFGTEGWRHYVGLED